MIGYTDKSMNFFIYLDKEEIGKLSEKIEGELFKYSTRIIVPFKMDSNFKYTESADWKHSKDPNSKINISIGKTLQNTLLETGKAYTRFYGAMGEELFAYEISKLDFTGEMNLEQVKFDMKMSKLKK